MAYTNFTIDELRERFKLVDEVKGIMTNVKPVEPSEWLKKSLSIGLSAPLLSEKARSEMLVSPMLLELRERNKKLFQLFSGVAFNVDGKKGLTGECDFMLSKPSNSFAPAAPIVTIVEAKDNDLDLGLPQCAAQLFAAQLFNKKHKKPLKAVHGSVTTGEQWQFLKLVGNKLLIDDKRYYLSDAPLLLGALQTIVNFYKN